MRACQAVDELRSNIYFFSPEFLDLLTPKYPEKYSKKKDIWREKIIGNGLVGVHRTRVLNFRVYLKKWRGHWML